MASYNLKLPGIEEINASVLVPVICLRVRQLFEVFRNLVDFAGVLVFRLCVLIVALCTVVYRLQKGRLVLLHHIGGGAAAG